MLDAALWDTCSTTVLYAIVVFPSSLVENAHLFQITAAKPGFPVDRQ